MRLSERVALWIVAVIPSLTILFVGLPWCLRVRNAIAEVKADVDRQEAIDTRLLTIYERVRKVQETIEKKFANEEGR